MADHPQKPVHVRPLSPLPPEQSVAILATTFVTYISISVTHTLRISDFSGLGATPLWSSWSRAANCTVQPASFGC